MKLASNNIPLTAPPFSHSQVVGKAFQQTKIQNKQNVSRDQVQSGARNTDNKMKLAAE